MELDQIFFDVGDIKSRDLATLREAEGCWDDGDHALQGRAPPSRGGFRRQLTGIITDDDLLEVLRKSRAKLTKVLAREQAREAVARKKIANVTAVRWRSIAMIAHAVWS